MLHRSAITDDGACLDIAVYGFWGGRFEKAFLDVRVFNPSAQSNRVCRIEKKGTGFAVAWALLF